MVQIIFWVGVENKEEKTYTMVNTTETWLHMRNYLQRMMSIDLRSKIEQHVLY
jgi:hypothetical protein